MMKNGMEVERKEKLMVLEKAKVLETDLIGLIVITV